MKVSLIVDIISDIAENNNYLVSSYIRSSDTAGSLTFYSENDEDVKFHKHINYDGEKIFLGLLNHSVNLHDPNSLDKIADYFRSTNNEFDDILGNWTYPSISPYYPNGGITITSTANILDSHTYSIENHTLGGHNVDWSHLGDWNIVNNIDY